MGKSDEEMTPTRTAPNIAFFLAALANLVCFTASQAQNSCTPVNISAVGDTLLIPTNADSIVVRLDRTPEEMSVRVGCLDVSSAGFYRLYAGAIYSGGKSNESFYIQIQYSDSTFAGLCDANAGPYKVIDVVEDIPDVESRLRRDAGVFYLQEGINTVILNHYALIADEFPDFIAPNRGFDGPESVHLYEIVLEYVTAASFDLALQQSVSEDSINIGESLEYHIDLWNDGPGVAYNVHLKNELPSFLDIDSAAFNISPDSITAGQFLYWSFDSLAPNDSIAIDFAAQVRSDATFDTLPLIIRSRCQIMSICDNLEENNVDSTQVKLTEHPPLPDISVNQTVRTDSFAVNAGDTTWYASEGGMLTYFFQIRNERRATAEDIWLIRMLPDSVFFENGPYPKTLRTLLGSLPPFADTVIVMTGTLADAMPVGDNLLVSKAAVSARSEDPLALSNNVDIDTVHNVVIQRWFDLSVRQSVKTDSFVVSNDDTLWYADEGETIAYEMTVAVDGNLPATDVTLINDLPERVSADGGETSVVFELGTMQPGSDTTLVLLAAVDEEMPAGHNLLVNNVQVTSSMGNSDLPDPLFNNVATDTVHNIAIERWFDLSLTESVLTDSFTVIGADTQWYAHEGSSYRYFMTVRVEGNIEANNVQLQNDLPDFVFTDGGVSSAIETFDLGDMRPGQDTTVVLLVNVDPDIPFGDNLLINESMVKAEGEKAGADLNNYASSTVYNQHLLEPTDVSISQRVRADSIQVASGDTTWYARSGHLITYSLRITNKRGADAVDVVVKDVVPDSLHVDGGFSAGDTLVWQLGTLAPFSERIVSFSANVSPDIAERTQVPLVNRAFVSIINELPEDLWDNSSILGEGVFALPLILYPEGCKLFTLSENVYQPATGIPLKITFNVNTSRTARLDVYDMTGQHVQKIAEGHFIEGTNGHEWNGMTSKGLQAGSGVYLVVLRSGHMNCWKKVILAR